MIVDLNIPVEGMNKVIFTKGSDPKHLNAEEAKQASDYANAYSAWESTKIGEAPIMPIFHYTPVQFAIELMKVAIRNSHKVGNTGHLRHIIRLTKDIDDQNIAGAKTLILCQPDIQFIKNNFSKVEWPSQPDDLIKFIVMVEDSLKNAKEK